jgi:hypothetical protein
MGGRLAEACEEGRGWEDGQGDSGGRRTGEGGVTCDGLMSWMRPYEGAGSTGPLAMIGGESFSSGEKAMHSIDESFL